MSEINNLVKMANEQSAHQVKQAMQLLEGAYESLLAQSSSLKNSVETTEKTESTNSPIFNAMKASSDGAQNAIEAAEAGVKVAILNAEKHVMSAVKSFQPK